jgi:hypothetical protein
LGDLAGAVGGWEGCGVEEEAMGLIIPIAVSDSIRLDSAAESE